MNEIIDLLQEVEQLRLLQSQREQELAQFKKETDALVKEKLNTLANLLNGQTCPVAIGQYVIQLNERSYDPLVRVQFMRVTPYQEPIKVNGTIQDDFSLF